METKLSPQGKRILELMADEARRLQIDLKNTNPIGTEHLLLGIIRGENKASQALRDAGLDLEKVRSLVVKHIQSTPEQ